MVSKKATQLTIQNSWIDSFVVHHLDIRLASPQRDYGVIPVIGDADNSLSMRWVKLGSTGCMNHADGAGGGRHVAATG